LVVGLLVVSEQQYRALLQALKGFYVKVLDLRNSVAHRFTVTAMDTIAVLTGSALGGIENI